MKSPRRPKDAGGFVLRSVLFFRPILLWGLVRSAGDGGPVPEGVEALIGPVAALDDLGDAALRRLHAAGATRCHCNLEAAPARFPGLCTTHTQAQKLATLRAALRAGMEICSGGIIGMGEEERDRIALAFALRNLPIASIPLNLLAPIPGTPLAGLPLLPERDVLRAVALFRLVHPTAHLRFAGGRKRLSPETFGRALRLGIDAAIEGDLLTTAGNTADQDRAPILRAGYALPC